MRGPKTSQGFSLLELVVAIGILGIVTVQILGIFSNQLKNYAGQKAVVSAQGDARMAADMIFQDVRMAGFMVPQYLGVSGVDGGTNGTDTLCVSDPSVFDDERVDFATDRFDGASLDSDVGGNDGGIELVAASMDLDGDGNRDFTVDSGIILADGTNTHCARITAISGNKIAFTPSTPGGFSATQVTGRAVPAVVYERTSRGLTRNALLLSRQVEDLQVEYAVDANDDGQIGGGEFPLNGVNGQNPALVRRLQLSVLTRTVIEDSQLTSPGRQAVANRNAAGSSDSYLRRLVTISAAPRNVL